jgi:hypothetical protein
VKLWLNLLGLTDQNYTHTEIAGRRQRSINFSVRRVVASHRVKNDLSRQTGLILRLISQERTNRRLGFFHLHHFAALVIPALGTDAMLQTRLLTIRTEGCLRNPQGIMRPAFPAASFRMSSFWIWHNYSNLK